MTFWERHKSAITFAGAIAFLFAVVWLGYLRSKQAQAEDLVAEKNTLRDQLAKYYFELKSDKKLKLKPTLAEVRRETLRRKLECEEQLKDLTNRVRFPFGRDFPWAEVVNNPNVVPYGMSWGVYVNNRYPVTRQNVELHGVGRGRITQLKDNWLGFVPSSTPASVSADQAEDNLRRLALAEKITKLAIDSGISWVLKVSPDKVEPDGAYYWGRKGTRRVRMAYKNKFIRNYPVQVQMIGSLDSVMRFFHSVRGERHFLVIRNFRIVGEEASSSLGEDRELMKDGQVLVTISAACMDFADESKKPKNNKPVIPAINVGDDNGGYVVPRKPTGH